MRNHADTTEMYRAVITLRVLGTDGNYRTVEKIAGPYKTKGTAKGAITQEVNWYKRYNGQDSTTGLWKYQWDAVVQKATLDWKDCT